MISISGFQGIYVTTILQAVTLRQSYDTKTISIKGEMSFLLFCFCLTISSPKSIFAQDVERPTKSGFSI